MLRTTIIGFLPLNKKNRKEKLDKIKTCSSTSILYEAPHKLKNSLESMLEILGNLKIYWYGFLIVLSFIVGLLLMKKNSKSFGIEYDDVLDWIKTFKE